MKPIDDRPVREAAEPPAASQLLDESGDMSQAVSPEVAESTVRLLLAGLGRRVFRPLLRGHRDVPDHWAFTPTEVDELAAPVTSIINRSAPLRRVAAASPELAVAMALSGWATRNISLTREIRFYEATKVDDHQDVKEDEDDDSS